MSSNAEKLALLGLTYENLNIKIVAVFDRIIAFRLVINKLSIFFLRRLLLECKQNANLRPSKTRNYKQPTENSFLETIKSWLSPKRRKSCHLGKSQFFRDLSRQLLRQASWSPIRLSSR